MKLNIEITNQENEKIIEIDVNCGNWKYWDNLMENNEKISLTMNNIFESNYLGLPVKDAYGVHDKELWENERKIQLAEAYVRPYETLHKYLCHRINNAKEDFKSEVCDIMEYKERGREYTATLFEEVYVNNDEEDIVKPTKYELETMITVKINWVE